MGRRIDNAVILTGPDCLLIYEAAKLRQLRVAARGRSDRLYALLTDITETAFASLDGTKSTEATEVDDAGDTGLVTVAEVARRAGITPRAVRNHIDAGLLQASQQGRAWVITTVAADQYIAGRNPA